MGKKVFESRPYQNRIHEKSIEYLKGEDNGIAKTILIESPTGSGKTVMAMRLAKYLEEQGHKIGIIAHRRELLSQAVQTSEDFFQLEDLVPISMFTRTPEQHKDRDVIIVDECLPADAAVVVIENNTVVQTTLGKVVNDKIGSSILSAGSSGLEFNTILNRTPMGRKEIWEVIVSSSEGEFVLLITAEGRIFADGEYRKVKDLQAGQQVKIMTSCWQKYARTTRCHEQQSQKQNPLPETSNRKIEECTILQMRMQEKSQMVPLYPQIQNLSIQSQQTSPSREDYLPTGTNYQRDSTGRRIHRIYKKSERSLHRQSSITNKTRTTPTPVSFMASARVRSDNFGPNCSFKKQRLRKSFLLLLNTITPKDIRNWERNLSAQKESNIRIFRNIRRSKSSCVVDGRRIIRRSALNTFILSRGTSDSNRMVQSEVQNQSYNELGQKKKPTLPCDKTTISFDSQRNNQTSLDPFNGIQSGVLKKVRKTGRYTETYDIGVDKVHNFFADGILVHNCQHDASRSASILHDTIRPKIIIGLTATPYRTDRANLCFQKVIKDAGIHQLIREGFLAEFNQFIYNEEWTPIGVARLYLSDPARWGKTVIYFLTTDAAVECARLLQEGGIAAGYVIGSEPRDEALKNFKEGRLDVLTNVAVLTEGFDEPSLKSAFVRPSSKGPTVQMAGRAFRKFPGLPVVNIVQNQDTKYPFTKHATAHNQFVMSDGEWRSIDPKNLTPIFIAQRKKIAMAKVDLPDYIKRRTKNGFMSLE